MLREVAPNLHDLYFDSAENQRIFNRVSDKCYLPANKVILDNIEKHNGSFKVAYSFSGIFLEQCQRYRPEVVDSFLKLVDSDCVELLEQTYYHSLVGLFEDPGEFSEQVKMHREAIWSIFGMLPTTFENTELIYNDYIAKLVQQMGYKAIFTEGVIADPSYVYKPKGLNIALLLRNYQLTDDIGFRFSSHDWEEYPLTAEKYATWLAATPGQCINIFCDYETFGEHQWLDTGIFEFLRYLPEKILARSNLQFATPAEIARDNPAKKEVSIEKYVSWADLDRDTSCWLGNALQQACFIYQQRLEAPAKESSDDELLKIWRILGLSDHLYYIFTKGGGPGEVHSYFSPYDIPYDASVTYFSILADMHYRLKIKTKLADEPFRFSTGIDQFTGDVAWSLKGLQSMLKEIEISSLEYHNEKGDMVLWANKSLGDAKLADAWNNLKGVNGERLRDGLLRAVKTALKSNR